MLSRIIFRRFCVTSMFSAVFFLSGCLLQREPQTWAKEDLKYIFDTVRENHPGMYNDLDPNFEAHLEQNYEQAKKQLGLVDSDEERVQILKTFAQKFDDTHLGVAYTQTIDKKPLQTTAHREFNITNLKQDIHWISLPTFAPNDQEQQQLKTIIQQMPTLRSSTMIVFDLRGNQGGNSAWGTEIIKTLFGNEYVEEHLAYVQSSVYVEWRASKDNVAHLNDLASINKRDFGPESPQAEYINNVLHGMQQAYAAGKPYYREFAVNDTIKEIPSRPDLVKAKIVVIIDSKCVSACLDFIDELKTMNHDSTLLGQTTKADSLYMEIRTLQLPSSKGVFWFPIKVYRNRPRGHNVPYTPDIPYRGDITNTDALQEFVQSVIKVSI